MDFCIWKLISLWCFITGGEETFIHSILFYLGSIGCGGGWGGRVDVCICGRNDSTPNQATTNSSNPVSTRPTLTRTRPDPQLAALMHAVPCRAVPGQEWLVWLGVSSYLLEFSVPEVCAKQKKMYWANKQMQQPYVFIECVCVCVWVCVCV